MPNSCPYFFIINKIIFILDLEDIDGNGKYDINDF